MKKGLILLVVTFLTISSYSYSEWTKAWDDSWCTEIGFFNGVAFISTGYSVYRSLDLGNTWSQANTGLPLSHVTEFGYAQGVYYAALANDGLYRTLDSGTTWESCNLKGYVCSIVSRGDDVFVGFNDLSDVEDKTLGIYRSTNKGADWQFFSRNVPAAQGSFIWGMGYNDQYFFNASEGGMFRTSNDGTTWEDLSQNGDISYVDARSFACIGNAILWSTSSEVYRSTNNGDTWDECHNISIPEYAVYKDVIFAREEKLLMSTDAGLTWTSYSDDFPGQLDMFSYRIGVIGSKICIGTINGLFMKEITSLPSGVEEYGSINNNRFEYKQNESRIVLIANEAVDIDRIDIISVSGTRIYYSDNYTSYIDTEEIHNGLYLIKAVINGRPYFQKLMIVR